MSSSLQLSVESHYSPGGNLMFSGYDNDSLFLWQIMPHLLLRMATMEIRRAFRAVVTAKALICW